MSKIFVSKWIILSLMNSAGVVLASGSSYAQEMTPTPASPDHHNQSQSSVTSASLPTSSEIHPKLTNVVATTVKEAETEILPHIKAASPAPILSSQIFAYNSETFNKKTSFFPQLSDKNVSFLSGINQVNQPLKNPFLGVNSQVSPKENPGAESFQAATAINPINNQNKTEEKPTSLIKDSIPQLGINADSLLTSAGVNEQVIDATTGQILAQGFTFPDVRGHWAQTFIEGLAARDIIRGFPDGTFRPDLPVTRAQFAALVNKAFARTPIRNPIQFADVPRNYWGYNAITGAYQIGFLQGYPNNIFAPEQNIPRVQVLVSLSNGLGLPTPAQPATILTSNFVDAASIPDYARNSIATATVNQLVVNYPNLKLLNPNQIATRADAAAFIYQALANSGQLPKITASDVASQYIVGYQTSQTPPPIASGNVGTVPSLTPEPVQPGQSQFQPQRIPLIPKPKVQDEVFSSPGISIITPTGYGQFFGNAAIGVGFQGRTRFTEQSDGAIGLSFGLGNPQKSVGFDVGVSIFNLKDSFGDRGAFSFKLHRLFPDDISLALGWQNAIVWGTTDAGSSGYLAASKLFRLQDSVKQPFSQLYLTAGVGTGQFRTESQINDKVDTVGVFGSASLRVIEPVNAIAEWTGQDLTLGISFTPFRKIPLVITPAIADVTNNAGDGARFILGVGYGFSFR